MEISVVIPTYARNDVLINSIKFLLPQLAIAKELIVVDQTDQHEIECEKQLDQWSKSGVIQWIKLSTPSVTAAMNAGLVRARGDIVLFLDDDIEPGPALIKAHLQCHAEFDCALVAGRVIQPWDNNEDKLQSNLKSSFNTEQAGVRSEFPGGNFSVKRKIALSIRGFDQNFKFAAYHYEREFADRIIASGNLIRYCPDAMIWHLQALDGGVRTYGSHLTTLRPGHSLGAYYYILQSGNRRATRMIRRFIGSIATRFHLTRPWYVPVTLVAELGGLVTAVPLWWRGPELLPEDSE